MECVGANVLGNNLGGKKRRKKKKSSADLTNSNPPIYTILPIENSSYDSNTISYNLSAE
jgi:hypothetical protein